MALKLLPLLLVQLSPPLVCRRNRPPLSCKTTATSLGIYKLNTQKGEAEWKDEAQAEELNLIATFHKVQHKQETQKATVCVLPKSLSTSALFLLPSFRTFLCEFSLSLCVGTLCTHIPDCSPTRSSNVFTLFNGLFPLNWAPPGSPCCRPTTDYTTRALYSLTVCLVWCVCV